MGEKFPKCIAETFFLKNLKMFTHIHCATLCLAGSQFILINLFTWALLSRFKQNLNTFILGCLDFL